MLAFRNGSRASGVGGEAAEIMNPLLKKVTLVVYDWRENQPGTLAWVFPSLGAAVRAVRAMKNAMKWLIVSGEQDDVDVVSLRRNGMVLLERFV
jgi:hypothetical protein